VLYKQLQKRFAAEPDISCYANVASMSKEHSNKALAEMAVRSLASSQIIPSPSTWANLLKTLCTTQSNIQSMLINIIMLTYERHFSYS
jgi:hypothetical protein